MPVSALIRAARDGDASTVRELIGQCGRTDEDGWSALMFAAMGNHIECVRELVPNEIGMRDSAGQTALHLAAAKGRVDVLPLLIPGEAGKQDDIGLTALMEATIHGHENCARLLLCEAGHQTTEAYRQKGKYGAAGQTALMFAVQHGYLNLVKLLLPFEQGLIDEQGHTARWYADQSGDSKIQKILCEEASSRLPPPPIPQPV